MSESGNSESPIIVIAGPTASGKSRLAVAVAREFRGAVINADSMQVYRDLRVVTARPGDAEMAMVPHHLYGGIDAAESCSAGRWRGLALAEIARAQAAGLMPVIAGGTGLYLSALLDGLADVPPVPETIVAEARELHARLGGEKFRAALAELDPAAAKRLHGGDTQRLIRAHAVARATGVALSEWQRRQRAGLQPDAAAIVLLPPREELYAAIDARLVSMFEAGAIKEVRDLLARELAPELPAMKAVGVREIALFIAGDLTREAALEAAQQASRRYAKRQYTWLRHRLKSGKKLQKLIIEAKYSERILPEIFSFIRQFLLTTRK
jgi:tRNA dimethylallyltransferase